MLKWKDIYLIPEDKYWFRMPVVVIDNLIPNMVKDKKFLNGMAELARECVIIIVVTINKR